MTQTSVHIHLSPESAPSLPCWFGEVAMVSQVLKTLGLLDRIQTKVRFGRARFGQYEVIDFLAVLIGYALSGEPTLHAFYARLTPFATPFMALFERHQLPHRSTLSRFLAALDRPAVEALRSLFQQDLVTRTSFSSLPGGLFDRRGERSRTTVLQPFTHQWIGTFSGPGNGQYRDEMQHALR